MSAATKKNPKEDGRHARAARTHHAIVTALLDLADEGELAPTAQAIATRAKVALRSIRQHFPTREELFVAAAEEHVRRVARAKVPGSAVRGAQTSRADRVTYFLEVRTKQLEMSSALRRAAAFVEPKSRVVRQTMRTLGKLRRSEVEAAFHVELRARSRSERGVALDALDVVTSGKTWDTLRYDMTLSESAAANVVKGLVTAILGTMPC